MKDALGAVQSVLVLGGTSELAAETVRALQLRTGARVLLAGRDEQALARVEVPPHASVVPLGWDARDTTGIPALLDRVSKALDGDDLDLVLLAAGILGSQERAESDPAHAVDVLETNLVGPAAVLLALSARLRAQGHGQLVVFSSVAGLRARRANFVYGASKAGLDAFAEGLAASLVGSGVTVTTVRPGFVRGRMTAGMDPAPFATTPAAVGAAVADAVRSGAEVVYVPRVLRPLFGVLRVLPRPLFRRLPG